MTQIHDQGNDGVAKIKVVGVGGGGCNAVSRLSLIHI